MKVDGFEKKINYKFKDYDILDAALTHTSFSNVFKTKRKKNYYSGSFRLEFDFERLEFLGDRVLSLVIANFLFFNYGEEPGALSKRHAEAVSNRTLVDVAHEINLSEMITLGPKEKSNLKKNKSVLSDVTEALIGAIYIDSGLKNAEKFIYKFWQKKITELEIPQDPKSTLQEIAQKEGFDLPKYNLKKKDGPAHNPRFQIQVTLKGTPCFSSIATSIKDAERDVAKKLLDYIYKKKIFNQSKKKKEFRYDKLIIRKIPGIN